LAFFSRLRAAVNSNHGNIVRIDHAQLEKISPAASLVLIAEVIRAGSLHADCVLQGNIPVNEEVRNILGEAGYWKCFSDVDWKPPTTRKRLYLEHRNGQKTSGETVKQLILHFLPEASLAMAEQKALYSALIECMDNVMKHAYDQSEHNGLFYRQWWLLAYRDSETHEISFCFFDQGLGIPKTIRTRFKDKFGPLSAPDSSLIVKAVIDGHYSSTKDPTRGRGLPTLKRLIDQAKSGELMIVSSQSRCIFSKSNQNAHDAKGNLGGTLIVWTLQRS
jgi:anti-sigma regulatory factor (Ser/Thr protein kinase)